jgi:hypothetical protein
MSEDKKKQRAPRLSRAEAAELLKEYEASGLSRVVFCEQRGMGITTLVRYFRWRSEDNAAARQRWVSVEGIRPTNPMTGGRGNSKTSLNLFVLGPSGRRELGDLLNRQIG